MKLSDIFPSNEQIKLLQGIESDLLRRRRAGNIGMIAALSAAIFQIILGLSTKGNYLETIGNLFSRFASGEWSILLSDEFIGIGVLIAGIGIYLLFRWTRFMLRDSVEPFHYTFWIKPFERVQETPDKRFEIKGEDRFHLLHHDLNEKLNERIRRVSLLDEDNLDPGTRESLFSHIHISGHYAIREERGDKDEAEWVIHVMPCIRIGPKGKPTTLAHPVKYTLIKNENATRQKDTSHGRTIYTLDPGEYNQIVNRVYSSIATEVYRKIKTDVKRKISLFPTPYLRAVALFHEAEDFSRSNTIDAYDHAIELYRESLRYFNIMNIGFITELLIRFSVLLWRYEVKFLSMWAKVEIGYAKCLIYRRQISALSGRYRNPLFEIPDRIGNVINNFDQIFNRINPKWKLSKLPSNMSENKRIRERNRLNTLMAFLVFPKDSWLRYVFFRPVSSSFENEKSILFNAYLVNALALYFLDAVEKAKENLKNAKAVDPQKSEKNALFMLTDGAIEPDIDKEISLFQKATEIAPQFQIAQYLLAYYSERRFRRQNEYTISRSNSVMNEYDRSLKINPGNISAIAAQGYLLWLLEDSDQSWKKFIEGCENKAVARETFIGELNYGLARIAAERGDFDKGYDLYNEAISVDPGICAYSTLNFSAPISSYITTSYYDYIDTAMLKRYERFKINVEKKIKALERTSEGKYTEYIENKKRREFSEETIDVVSSFVLNDYGNACLNYFHRFGYSEKLEEAIESFEEAIRRNPKNFVAYYNLQNACTWRGDQSKDISAYMDKAEKLAPSWPELLIASAELQLFQIQESIKKKTKELEKANKRFSDQMPQSGKVPEDSYFITSSPQGQPKEKLNSRKVKTDNEGGDQHPILITLENEVNVLREKLKNEVFEKITELMEQTKLSALFEGLKINYDGRGIEKIINYRIEVDRLDENDIKALKVWARVFSSTAIDVSEKLCHYIQKYYPDDFDANLILYNIYNQLKKSEAKSACRNKIKIVIENWLAQDPTNHASLTWIREYFDFDSRVKILNRAIDFDRNNHVYHNMLGNDYFDQHDWQQAVVKYKDAVGINPKIAVYHANMGAAYREMEEWDKAEEEYKKAIDLESRKVGYFKKSGDSKKGDYFNGLGNIYFGRKEYRKAIENYKKALRVTPEMAVCHSNIALAYRNLKEWDKAEKEYNRAIELEPENGGYFNSLGNMHFGRKEFRKAIENYEKAIKIKPEVSVYHLNLGDSYSELKEWDKAEEGYTRAIELEPKNGGYFNSIGNMYFDKGEYPKAIENYEKAIKIDPGKAVYHSNIALAYRNLKEWDKAEAEYKRAIDLDPEKDGCLNGLGNIYFGKGEYRKAIESYERAIKIKPDVSVYHLNLGDAHNELKEWDKAEEEYKRLMDLDPENDGYLNGLGTIYFGKGEYFKAIENYKKAIKIKPEVIIYHLNLAESYKNLKIWDKAEEEYKKTLKIEPENSDIFNRLGNMYLVKGNLRKAVENYEKALQINPKTAVYHLNIGEAYKELKEWKKAEEQFKKAMDLEPQSGNVFNGLGNMYFNKGDYRKAIENYKEAVKIDPGSAIYHSNLGTAFKERKKWKRAEKEYKKAVVLDPKNSKTLNLIGNMYFGKGDYTKAIENYEKALEINPEIAVYHSNISLAWEYKSLTGERLNALENAVSALQKACELEPENVEYSERIKKLREKKI
ncbi:MAG: tetratricopeptide repeat protein [bacterium]